VKKLLLLPVLFLSTAAWAQMYKCVDERGVTSYSDQPRPGCKGGKVEIQPIPSVSGKTAAPEGSIASQDADFKRRQIEREQALAQDKTTLAQRCAQLKYEQDVLALGGRIFTLNERGERIYVEDATRDARLARLKEEMRGCP
jgi:hypothetical protein